MTSGCAGTSGGHASDAPIEACAIQTGRFDRDDDNRDDAEQQPPPFRSHVASGAVPPIAMDPDGPTEKRCIAATWDCLLAANLRR